VSRSPPDAALWDKSAQKRSPNHECGESIFGHGKRINLHLCPGSISPNKVGRTYMEQIEGTSMPPEYDE